MAEDAEEKTDYSEEINEMEKKLAELKEKQEEARKEEERKREEEKRREEERKREEEERKRIEEEKKLAEEKAHETEEAREPSAAEGLSFNVGHLKILAIVVIVALVGGFIFFDSFNIAPSAGAVLPVEDGEETQAAEAVEVQLIKITHPACSENKCITLDTVIAQLKDIFSGTNASISEEKTLLFGSPETSELIEKYSIKKLPSLIVLGETEKIGNLQEAWSSFGYGSKEKDNALVVRSQLPIFFDLTENRFKGRVKLINLTHNACQQCTTEPINKQVFTLHKIKIVSEESVDASSEKGAALINAYNITRVPTVILSKEIKDYAAYTNFSEIASEEADGSLVFREVNPLYHDLSLGRIVGNLFIVYIVDSSCQECFTAETLRNSLVGAFGLKTYQEDVIEYNESVAQDLIQKYNITRIPTALITGASAEDIMAYYLLRKFWANFGIAVGDRVLVFTNQMALGKGSYRDLISGEIVQIG